MTTTGQTNKSPSYVYKLTLFCTHLPHSSVTSQKDMQEYCLLTFYEVPVFRGIIFFSKVALLSKKQNI